MQLTAQLIGVFIFAYAFIWFFKTWLMFFTADMFDGEMSEEDNSKENLAVDKEKKVRVILSRPVFDTVSLEMCDRT